MDDNRSALEFLNSFDQRGAQMALDLIIADDNREPWGDGGMFPLEFEEIDQLVRWHPLTRELYHSIKKLTRAKVVQILRKIMNGY